MTSPGFDRVRSLALAALVTLAGCGGTQTGPRMLPGSPCLTCHADDPTGEGAPAFALGGTVFSSGTSAADGGVGGVIVRVTDTAGVVATTYSNGAGNFYWGGVLALPLAHAELERDGAVIAMQAPPPAGDCNACHGPQTQQGRLHAP